MRSSSTFFGETWRLPRADLVSDRDRLGVCPISCLTWCQCICVSVPVTSLLRTSHGRPHSQAPLASRIPLASLTIYELSTARPLSSIAFHQSKRSEGRPTARRAECITSHRRPIPTSFPFRWTCIVARNIPETSYIRPTLSTPQLVQRVHRNLCYRILCMRAWLLAPVPNLC